MERNFDKKNDPDITRKLADMQELQRISTKLIQENDVNRIYREILNTAVAIVRSDMASMQLFIPETDELLLLAYHGFHPDSAKHWERVKPGIGSTCGMSLIRGGKRIIVQDIEQCEFIVGTEDHQFFRRSNIRSVQTTPLISRNGNIVGMISTHWKQVYSPTDHDLSMLDILARQATDLIERWKAEEALRESEARLKSTIDAALMGTFVWDIEKKAFMPDSRMLQLFGNPSTAIDPVNALRSAIHPGDFTRFLRSAFSAGNPRTNGILHGDIRLVLPSGLVRWLALHARVQFSEYTGKSIRITGGAMDITERKTLEIQKDEFINIASHELKTPITVIKAYVQLLSSRFESNNSETNLQLLSKLGKQMNRLADLVHRLVTTTRILNNQIELSPEQADLNSLVSEYIAELQPLTQVHRLIFNAGDIPPVDLDRNRIGDVIASLILNAIRYSPNGGDINIKSEMTEIGDVRLSIEDQGIGISEEQKIKVFDRLSKGNVLRMPGSSGIGLSLYNAASVITLHGGRIGVESEPGKGSIFHFTLPPAKQAAV